MSRPTKAVVTSSKNLTNEEKEVRAEVESNLKGDADKIKPSSYLNKEQKKIFKFIVSELKESGILGNLDIYVLENCSIAIDRIREIEKKFNEDINNISNSKLMSAKKQYQQDFFRCCNELSLSPQARAKIGVLTLNSLQAQNDELLQALQE